MGSLYGFTRIWPTVYTFTKIRRWFGKGMFSKYVKWDLLLIGSLQVEQIIGPCPTTFSPQREKPALVISVDSLTPGPWLISSCTSCASLPLFINQTWAVLALCTCREALWNHWFLKIMDNNGQHKTFLHRLFNVTKIKATEFILLKYIWTQSCAFFNAYLLRLFWIIYTSVFGF